MKLKRKGAKLQRGGSESLSEHLPERDIVETFAREINLPPSAVLWELRITQHLHQASFQQIIEKYHALTINESFPLIKLRYLRLNWKSINKP